MNSIYECLVWGWDTNGTHLKWGYRLEVTQEAEERYGKVREALATMTIGNATRDGMKKKDGEVSIRKLERWEM